MKGKLLGLLIAVLLLTIVFSGCFEETKKTTTVEPKTVYVDDSGGKDYTSIQDAIDSANAGDTVYVYNGMYNENIAINKAITLIGEDKSTTIINGNVYDKNVLKIEADYVNISGFTIQKSGFSLSGGIEISSNYDSITNNIITNNSNEGIRFTSYYYNNVISGNTITNNEQGIYFLGSNNVISDNTIFSNNGPNIIGNVAGIGFSGSNNIVSGNTITNNNGTGIDFTGSNNVISGNNITNNYNGIFLQGGCNNNTISGNTISKKDHYDSYIHYGIYIRGSFSNIIYHNNLLYSPPNAYTWDEGNNTWYNATLKEGNYWDDYNGTDANSDGIGDTPYNISGGNNQDVYPLVTPFDI